MRGFDAGDEAAEFLAGYLGSPVRLVRSTRGQATSNPQWTQGVEALNQFSDGYPWLLISKPRSRISTAAWSASCG